MNYQDYSIEELKSMKSDLKRIISESRYPEMIKSYLSAIADIDSEIERQTKNQQK